MRTPDRRLVDIRAVLVVVCLVAAAVFRLYRLDFQSLWLDELFSVVFSGPGRSIPEIVAAYANDVHPLGYPLLLHFWLVLFGDSAVAARALSAVFGVAGVGAMLAAGTRCFDARTGVIAAALTTVNAFHIAYSQEARAYSLVFLLAVCSYWSFLTVLAKPGWRAAAVYGLVTAVSIHVHYYGFVVLFGQLAAGLAMLASARRNWARVWPLLAGAALAGTTVVPWIRPLLRVASIRDVWPAPPAPWFFAEYFDAYFGNQPVLSIAFGALLAALPLLLLARTDHETDSARVPHTTAAGLLGGAVAVSLAAAYARSVLSVPMLVPKVTIAFLPALLLLIALALSKLRPVRVGTAVSAALVAASIVVLFSSGYYSEPRKEQWREAVRHMLSDPRFDPNADVCLAVLAPGFQWYADQYGSPVKIEDADPERLDEAIGGRSELPSVWLLVARDEGAVRDLRRELRGRWNRTDRTVFLKTSVERWEPEVRPGRTTDDDAPGSR